MSTFKRRAGRFGIVVGIVVVAVTVVIPLVQAAPKTAPGAPTLSSATGVNTAVNLTWAAPSNNGGSAVTGYKVYRGTTSGSLSLVATLGVTTTYSNTGLTNGTTYYFAVSAVNAQGEGVKSSVLSAVPTTTVSSAPTLSSAAAGNAVVNLTWSAPADNGGLAITGYKVYRGTTSGSLSLVTTLGVTTTYSNTGLTNGTTYYFAVSAVNAKGESAKSAVLSATPAPTVSTAPTLTTATAGNASVALAWSAPSSNGGAAITGYKLYRGTASGSLSLVTTLGAVTTTTDASLTNGTTYFYAVTAVNSAGESARSNELSAQPLTVPGAPVVTATSNASAVGLTWTAPSNGGTAITGYQVYQGTSSGSLSLVATLGAVTSYSATPLTNGTTYYFAVSAVNAKGEGAKSTTVSSVPSTTPGAPTLTATPANATVNLSWTTPANGGAAITGYQVYRGTTSGSLSLVTTLGVVNTYANTGLTNGTPYFFTVAAVNAKGAGAASGEATATPLTVAGAPTLTAASRHTAVDLTWTTPSSNGGSAITGYKVYRGTTSGSLSLLATLGVVNSYTNSGLTNGTLWYYAVTAINGAGESVKSNVASATPNPTVSAPPVLASATPGNALVNLTWVAPGDNGGAAITGYKVYRGTTSGSLSLVATLGVTTTYSSTGLTNGTPYFFAVTAVNAKGESAKSNQGSATPVTTPSAPTLAATSPQVGAIDLSWSAPGNGGSAITGYRVYRGTTSGALSLLTTVAAGTTTYTDGAVSYGTTYFYAVSAVNAVGEGPRSAEKTGSPTANAPSPPTLTSAAGNNSSVTIYWTVPANGGAPIIGYRIYRGASEGSLAQVATVGTVTGYTDNALVNGAEYFYAVTAVNAVGESVQSNVLSATPASVPSAPLLNSATGGPGKVDLAWTAASPNGSAVWSYKVLRGTSSGSLSVLTTLGAVTSFTDTNVTNGVTYYYALIAVNGKGSSIQSNVRSAVPSAAPTTTSTTTTTAPTPTTSLPPGNVNNPAYWEALGYGTCVKYDPTTTPYILGAAPAGYFWSLLVIKAGSESSNSDWLTRIENPNPGTYYHPSGKTISHVIVCKKPGGGGGSTTTSPGTTVPGDPCTNYTPTHLALSQSSAEPGQTITITGTGAPGDSLTVTIARAGHPDQVIGFAVVDGTGHFSVNVIIPDSYPPGNYTITVKSHACECPPSSTTSPSTTAHHEDDDGGHSSGDDDAHRMASDDDGSGHDDDDGSGHGGGGGGGTGCSGASKAQINVQSLDLSGCGPNSYDRVFAPGETITWTLMASPFDTSKVPVTLTLVSRTPGGPTYPLYSGSYPVGLNVSFTVPAGATIDQYYLNQTGRKSNNQVLVKSCPVRVGFTAVLASSSKASSSPLGPLTDLAIVGVGVALLSTLRLRRYRRASTRL